MLARDIAEESGLDDRQVMIAVLDYFQHDAGLAADSEYEYQRSFIAGGTVTICDAVSLYLIFNR